MRCTGVVLEVHAGRCLVYDDDGAFTLSCVYRGRLARGPRRSTSLLVVGDRVAYERDGPEGVVVEVSPRRNELSRRAAAGRGVQHVLAANVDQAIIVVAVEHPRYRTGFIDRCMAAARFSNIVPVLVMNKIDLAIPSAREELESVLSIYRGAEMSCLIASARESLGIETLRGTLAGRSSVFVGPSGAGKSSLLNVLEPGLRLDTGEVSEATQKGRHTTTRSRLVPLASRGFVVDTPGVRAFGLIELGPIELALAYPEFRGPAARCRFKPCSHTHEPSCAVAGAVRAGEIPAWRYENYCRLLGSIGEDEA
jgi:ribosome biogenesis GTPase